MSDTLTLLVAPQSVVHLGLLAPWLYTCPSPFSKLSPGPVCSHST